MSEQFASLPRGWRRTSLARLCSAPIQAGADYVAGPLSDDAPVRYLRTTDIATLHRLTPIDSAVGVSHRQASAATVRAGDLLMTRSGSLGTSHIYSGDEACYAGYLVRARINDMKADRRFVAWWTQSVDHLDQVKVGATRSTIDNFSASKFAGMRVPLPAVATQHAIADLLDRETALIDRLVEKQNALIERLRERRRGVILRGVTGATRDERKPANMGWADSVPTSWDVFPLDYLAVVTLGKMVAPTPSSDRAVLAPYLRAANVQPDGASAFDDLKEMWFEPRELAALTVEAGDVVVVEGGQGGFGRAAFVPDDLLGVGFQNSINRLRPRGSDGRFLAYALIAVRATGYMHVYCDAVSMPHLTAEKLARLRIGAPSLEEQRAIADYLDRETARIDGLISKVERHIELARERRSALITAAVTGQIDVGAA